MKNINAFLIALLLSTLFFSSNTQAQQINTAKLDSFFNVLVNNNRVMGSFVIAKDGKIIYHKTTGYSQVEEDKKIPATAETQYRIGSITKTFTATMIFQLIDEKKLSLDIKLSKFFPEMPNADRITIANLLNHSSGLADHVNENGEWITNPHTKAELLDKIAKVKPHFEPGAKIRYSNGGYLLLGYIIEKVTGKTYAAALKQRITNKIGTKSIIAGTINNSQKLEARPYKFTGQWTAVKDIYFPNVVAVGDILSTPQDLIVFINALTSGKLVSAESFKKMKSFEGSEKDFNPTGMGLFRIPFYEKTFIGHNGGTYGSISNMYANTDDGMSLAFTTNGMTNFSMNDITLAMLNAYYDKPYKIPVFKTVDLKTEDLNALLGNYTSKDLPLKISITKSGSTLMAQATGQTPFPLDAVSKDEFKQEQYDVLLKFDREKHEMTLIQGGKNFHYVIEK
ncbi:serine hydrolase domain-containing protein [Pedobacter frigoris]|uniref:Beta-lactamase family protein n=1 Tax=Pedobacter frigoris TaxID=2571272 RepID=A0A4U1CHR9_9SPHI|nr:serine hydrolase domain-containing protein [Pedobacter frigoris]TKC06917.1 beta-lactamase family protein [Pedobacter frigoris]